MYCRECGDSLARVRVDGDIVERIVCGGCGYIDYENPKVLVWCFAHWQGRLLLCRRAQEPARGLWNPPAGFVEQGETLEEAAVREMYEEAGVRVSPSDLTLYRVASVPHMNEVYVGFRTEFAAEPCLKAGPEAIEVRLCAEGELPPDAFAFRTMLKNVPDDFYHCLQTGEFPVFSVAICPDISRSSCGRPLNPES